MKKSNIFIIILSILFANINYQKSINNFESENIKIQDIKYEENEIIQELDTSIVDTYNASTHVLGQFTAVAKINSISDLAKYSVIKAKPGSVILYVNKDLNLINENNEDLGITLKNAYKDYIQGKMIPIIYIKDNDTANAFIEYYPYNMNILDMAVASNNPLIVKQVREVNTTIRGIVDYSDAEITSEKWSEVVKESNSSYASSIILNNNDATNEAINYIQARLKTVWVEVDETSTLNVLEQINNGASGLVCKNTDYIYSATNVYLKTDNILRNLNRKPYNIAHRGILTNYENSLEGCIEAYENGATHLEVDVQITKDNRLAIMHDATIDRTTTGTGAISDYTYDELKQFKIDSSSEGVLEGEGVNIPLLDDFLEYFQDKDVVLVVECKTTNTKIVTLLREVLEKYNAFDKVIFISFYPGVLAELKKTIPEVPLSTLGSISIADFATGLEYINTKNSAVNTTINNAYPDLTRYLIARGLNPWHWTYLDADEIQKGFVLGVQGLTNDCATELKDFSYKLTSDKEYIEVSSFENIEVKLNCETYGGSSDKVLDAKPLYIEEHRDYAYAIFYASFQTEYNTSYTFCIFSDVIKLIKK